MTTEEKLKELARIVAEALDALLSVAPHNYQQHLVYLQECAVSLVEDDEET